ncbi:T9SS C-terminal target domain-containing protein [candidate division KSB1 bacterium]|nr:T9SS type A sorting domain-containing protein [candidate division KSB1 bacterium]RQV99789.1 MAG: T9SS C-terminal target domain-containing protein [candidate division KSB1 bacterium]
MKWTLKTFAFILMLMIRLPSQTSEMSSTSYSIKRSSVLSAGETAIGQSYVLDYQLGLPHLGGMEGGQFIIGASVVIKAVEGDNTPPSTYSLSQNYPNPFNQRTKFLYGLPAKSDIEISVYSVLGQRLLILFSGEQNAGRFTLDYNGVDAFNRPLPSGLYFCHMTSTKGFDKTIKFAILR